MRVAEHRAERRSDTTMIPSSQPQTRTSTRLVYNLAATKVKAADLAGDYLATLRRMGLSKQ